MSKSKHHSRKPQSGRDAADPSPQTVGLQENDASFHILFIDNPQPMWVYDIETLQFLEVNDAAVQYYGYSRDEFLNMSITDIRPQEDLPRLMENIRQHRPGLQHSGSWR